MPPTRHVIVSHQLLGDGLMVTPAVRALRKSLPAEDTVTLITGPEGYNRIHLRSPYADSVSILDEKGVNRLKAAGTPGAWVPVNGGRMLVVDAGVAFSWCRQHPKVVRGPHGVQMEFPHLAHGFASQVGVKLDSCHYDVSLTPEELAASVALWNRIKPDPAKPSILCAALSTSCTSRDPKTPGLPPNKMLPERVWSEVVARLSPKYNFIFVGGPGEKTLEVEGANWRLGEDIRTVAGWCKAAACVISIDTGIGHVAQAVDANIVSVCAAVERTMTSVEDTYGKYACVDRTGEPWGAISNVTADEIIEEVNKVTGCGCGQKK